jgi:hypothetical protein
MCQSLQTKRARTSLIDAEWDWIANRLTERDGRWAVASVVNPSLARIVYAPPRTQPLPGLQVARALAAQSRTWKSADLATSVASGAATGRPSSWAVLLTALVGLAAGALLHRAGTGSGEQPPTVSSVPTASEECHGERAQRNPAYGSVVRGAFDARPEARRNFGRLVKLPPRSERGVDAARSAQSLQAPID